jgi:hypothetical protein
MSWRFTLRSSRRGDLRWWISIAAIASLAAGMAYLLETREGRGRRIRISQRTGVGAVKSFLHLPGTPAPNKTADLVASAEASSEERWPEEPPPDVDSEDAVALAAAKEN